MVARRLREQELHARTVHLKLRYSDFTTLTRAHTLAEPTQLDSVLLETVGKLFNRNWQRGRPVRLLGVGLSNLESSSGQMALSASDNQTRWQQALSAADRMRDRFGDGAVSLGSALNARFRERTHENPAERKRKTD